MLAAAATLAGIAAASQATAADSTAGGRNAAAEAGGVSGRLGLSSVVSQAEQQLRMVGEQAQQHGR
ncbi:hypothetical protein DQ392_32390 [Streptomyces reniochalinae]|uniref:Uncharacterized protein n=2 Tax=Streptomyces reniochalinae TaxID=2250578 RepID=A0A367E8H3_9ACTN|nr:hypothetical protein DQ392_32390 [Streptomyces reniochalinae]